MVQMLAILCSNGQKDMKKLTVTHRNCFASAPECCHHILARFHPLRRPRGPLGRAEV
jgi:hypothetical protein